MSYYSDPYPPQDEEPMTDRAPTTSDPLRMFDKTAEPVAWMHVQGNYAEPSSRPLDDDEIARGWTQRPLLYAHPPAAEPVAWLVKTLENIVRLDAATTSLASAQAAAGWALNHYRIEMDAHPPVAEPAALLRRIVESTERSDEASFVEAMSDARNYLKPATWGQWLRSSAAPPVAEPLPDVREFVHSLELPEFCGRSPAGSAMAEYAQDFAVQAIQQWEARKR